jgi:hypothetical protein
VLGEGGGGPGLEGAEGLERGLLVGGLVVLREVGLKKKRREVSKEEV